MMVWIKTQHCICVNKQCLVTVSRKHWNTDDLRLTDCS